MSCISLLYEVMQKYAVNHVRGKIFMVKVECGVRNDGRLIGQRNIGFYNSKASSRKYIKTSPEHKNIFRNFEDEHRGICKKLQSTRWNSKVTFNYSFIESRIDSFAYRDIMQIKN